MSRNWLPTDFEYDIRVSEMRYMCRYCGRWCDDTAVLKEEYCPSCDHKHRDLPKIPKERFAELRERALQHLGKKMHLHFKDGVWSVYFGNRIIKKGIAGYCASIKLRNKGNVVYDSDSVNVLLRFCQFDIQRQINNEQIKKLFDRQDPSIVIGKSIMQRYREYEKS